MISRRRLLQGLAAGGIAGLLHDVLAAGAHAGQGVRRVAGDVRIDGRPASVGQAVAPGATVVTGPGAEAIYVIGSDAFLQRGDSRVVFGADAARDFMRVATGRILSVFGRGDKRLRTNTATIGVRGTACYIEDEGVARSYFCLCYGEAEVMPHAAPQQRELIRTRHHDHPIYIHADAGMPTSMVPAEVINHTDAELKLLEALVGRLPPFGDEPY